MSDLNEIFGYKVYKPPKEELPVIEDLNVEGEIVTSIDPYSNVIEDPTVQALLESLDGDRTVRVDDLPPDMRYSGWNRKVEYDDKIIKNHTSSDNLKAKEPQVNQTLLQENAQPKPFSINSARPEVAELLAQQRRQQELQQQQFALKQQKIEEQKRILEEKKRELYLQQLAKQEQQQVDLVKQQQKEYQQQVILHQIKQQQARLDQIKTNHSSSVATPEQQATIQRLLLELAKLNPQLALQTLQQFKSGSSGATSGLTGSTSAATQQRAPQQQQQQQQQSAAKPSQQSGPPPNLALVHNMGSIHSSEPSQFTSVPPSAIRPTLVRPNPQ